MTTEIQKVLGIIAGLWVLYQGYERIIKPHLRKTKLKRLYHLIEDWFYDIQQNFDKGMDIDDLYVKEKKIAEFIRDHFDNHKLRFTKKIRMRFLKKCGVKSELLTNKELFQKFSRMPSDYIYVDFFWQRINSNFCDFYRNFKNQSGEINLGNVEMPLKMFKLYLNVKQE